MGATAAALGAAIATTLVATSAMADCVARRDSGREFPVCFDVGNQVWIELGSDGFGVGARFRHLVHFDDEPDLVWKLDHRLLDVQAGGLREAYLGSVYRGRFLRHARDGHVILPLAQSKKLFLPFDVGAELDIGTVRGSGASRELQVEVIRAALLTDWSRSASFRRRFALGPVGRWDLRYDRERDATTDHVVVPFSALGLNAYWESVNGLTWVELSGELGAAWTQTESWGLDARAGVRAERVLIALNDRPLALFLGARWDSARAERIAEVGLRWALVQRRDARTVGTSP